MSKSEAAIRADEYIKLILQNQQNVLGAAALSNEDNSMQIAQSIAALRAELIKLFEPQT